MKDAAPVMDKRAVEAVLDEMAELLALQGANQFRVRAYETAARRIGELDVDLAGLVDAGTLTDIPGIGESMARHIGELVRSGRMTEHEQLKAEFPPGVLELLRIPDLGPKKVAVLRAVLGVEDVDALERACREGEVAGLKGFGRRTEEKILEGIAELRRHLGRRLLADARPLAEALVAHLREAPEVVRVSEAGSVRRWKEEVGDLDVVCGSKDPAAVMDRFLAFPGVHTVLGRGDTKCSVRLEDGLQVDLRVVPDARFATALAHFTGSKAHNVRLRGLAQARGMKISEWGVFEGTRRRRARTEAELYGLLGMPYVPPELREDQGEIEAALEGALPGLVEAGDVVGLIHQHTRHSDGAASVREMAEAARDLGYAWMTITDHSVSSRIAHGLEPARLLRLLDEIDEVNAGLEGFTVLKGAEVDILDDGRLDYDDALLARLDLVVASVHSRLAMEEGAMTRRLLRAVRHPRVHVLGHPTGRLLHARPPSTARWDEVFAAAAEAGTALEVNGSPARLDLPPPLVRRALRAGCRLALGTDAHSVSGLAAVRYALATARRGWAGKADVLNCLSARALKRALRAAKAPVAPSAHPG